jgi:hypothetical protein
MPNRGNQAIHNLKMQVISNTMIIKNSNTIEAMEITKIIKLISKILTMPLIIMLILFNDNSSASKR